MIEFKVNGNSLKAKFVRAILPSLIRQLNLENSSKCFVVQLERGGAVDGGGFGATIPIGVADGYMVVINSQKRLAEIARTLAHELVHVKQMAKGQLKILPKHYVWMGKKYSKNTAYLDMPWEQEAFAKQEMLMRRAIEE